LFGGRQLRECLYGNYRDEEDLHLHVGGSLIPEQEYLLFHLLFWRPLLAVKANP
jgi:hypothetical protein